MEDKKLFMVDAKKIRFYWSETQSYSMSCAISLFLNEEFDDYGNGKQRKIPFMKTDSIKENEYIEMITGIVYYRENDEYVTYNNLVRFNKNNIESYHDELLGATCEGYPLFIIKLAMKTAYKRIKREAKRKYEEEKNEIEVEEDKSEKGAKILSKLKRKHGLK